MAVTAVSGLEVRRPVPRLRLLEDERWLALALLVPTAVLLGLFIAYPFFEGVMLSLSSARVGIPGEFIGLKNFSKIWDDSIFRTAVWNTFWYTGVTTVFKLALVSGVGRHQERVELTREPCERRGWLGICWDPKE